MDTEKNKVGITGAFTTGNRIERMVKREGLKFNHRLPPCHCQQNDAT